MTRISEMKSFYRDKAERFCQAGSAGKAKVYFQRYLLIDPNDRHVQARAAKCDELMRKSRATAKPGTEKDQDDTDKTAVRQERVKQLLEDSGVESNWMMDFLFEGKDESAEDAETPW
jgi:Tfp pilus assembly protein PilF